MRIPLLDVRAQHGALRKELWGAARRVLDSGIYILGPEGKAFETEFARTLGLPPCAGLASGTDALKIGLEACGVRPGDEVIVPAFTFIATATAVSSIGAVPVFADVEPDSLTLCPRSLERAVGRRTRAVIPVHLYGYPADMDPILALARRKGLRVIEDCAQAHLTRYRGKPAGSLGDVGTFSFYPTKNLGALGDAGCVVARGRELLDACLMLRDAGRLPGERYRHAHVGYNSRLDELQAALLRVKLRRLARWNALRREIAGLYREAFAGLPLRLPPAESGGTRHAYHLFVVQTPRRDALAARLAEAGIASAVYYPIPLHRQPAFRGLPGRALSLAQSERACREVLALPLYPEMGLSRARRVAREVRRFFGA